MLDFDKELSTFYQLLDEIETEERLLGDAEDALSASVPESGRNGRSDRSSAHSGGVSSTQTPVVSTVRPESVTEVKRTEAPIENRISSLLSALSNQRRIIVGTVAAVGILMVGISHGGTLIKKSLGLVSQSEPSTVSLTISTEPGGARVFVDGELVGVSPFQDVQISSRSRVVEVLKPGFERLDSLIDASRDLALVLPLESTSSDAKEVSIVRATSLHAREVPSLPEADSLNASPADSLMASVGDTLVASANDTLISSFELVALRLPTRPVEDVRPTLQTESEPQSSHKARVIGEQKRFSDLTVDEFSRLRSEGDERYGAGLYSEAVTFYEQALQLRPGNTAVVNSIRMARAAAAIDELPSTVFSSDDATE